MKNEPASEEMAAGRWESESPEETFEVGRRIGERLEGGELILLSGELGAGKTVFVKGVAAALGIDRDEVTSPSFTLVNRYDGRYTLYHLDLYRLDDGPGAAHAVDLDELLREEGAVIIIEWAERMGDHPLPEGALRVRIEGDGDTPRVIKISRA